MKHTFDYITVENTKGYHFLMIPFEILKNDIFSILPLTAKLTYAIFLDRSCLSVKNGWVDNNHVYIIYPLAAICQDLNISRNTARKMIRALEDFGLIDIVPIPGGANRIYVHNFAAPAKSLESPETKKGSSKIDPVPNGVNGGAKIDHEPENQGVQKLTPNHTNTNIHKQTNNVCTHYRRTSRQVHTRYRYRSRSMTDRAIPVTAPVVIDGQPAILGRQRITQDEYAILCASIGKTAVNRTILRIISHPYYGMLRPEIIQQWAAEDAARTRRKYRPAERRQSNSFCDFHGQRDYDYAALEADLLAVSGAPCPPRRE